MIPAFNIFHQPLEESAETLFSIIYFMIFFGTRDTHAEHLWRKPVEIELVIAAIAKTCQLLFQTNGCAGSTIIQACASSAVRFQVVATIIPRSEET